MSTVTSDLAVGAAAGYGAGTAMDQATTWFMEGQSDASKRREQELAPGGAPSSMARKLAGAVGVRLGDEQAGRLGGVIHRSLGPAYGMAAAALVRRGAQPLQAGILAAAAGFVLVDEGTNSVLRITPPPRAYPAATHLRGVAGHLTFGLALAAMLAVARRLGATRP